MGKIKRDYFDKKEQNDFKRLCTIHGFKNRKMVKESSTDIFGQSVEVVKELNIFLPSVMGGQEKMLGNVARYTHSRRIAEPCMISKNKVGIKVSFRKNF